MTQITLRKLSKPDCRPCATVTNYLESIAVELLAAEVDVIEHDVVAEPAIAAKYGVMSVPVLIVERNGRVYTKLTGLTAPSEILDAVRSAKEDV